MRATVAPARVATASAPAKVILLGEHAVNRGGVALATALDRRVRCRVTLSDDGRFALRAGHHEAHATRQELDDFAARVDAARAADDLPAVAALGAGDFLGPGRYVLAALAERLGLSGLEATWEEGLPVGTGLGSGAAAHGALAVAAATAAGVRLVPSEVAALAWRGDVLAHGGIASALDGSAVAHGGVVAYAAETGATAVACPVELPLVVSDTGASASTGAVNTAVRRRLEARPALGALFDDLVVLVAGARSALEGGDLPTLGRLMHLDQLVLEKLGVSTEPIERLVDSALAAGALGAKLSGSGGGGIVIALTPPDATAAVAEAMTAAGGCTFVAAAAVAGAHADTHPDPQEAARS